MQTLRFGCTFAEDGASEVVVGYPDSPCCSTTTHHLRSQRPTMPRTLMGEMGPAARRGAPLFAFAFDLDEDALFHGGPTREEVPGNPAPPASPRGGRTAPAPAPRLRAAPALRVCRAD